MTDLQKGYSDKFLAKTFLLLIPQRVTPNQITWARLLSSPIVFYLLWVESYAWGATLFILSALTDALDGAKARTRDQVTETGKILDPIADRALILAAALSLIPRFYGWPLFIALFVLELFQSIRAHFLKEKLRRNLNANWAGKIKMITQVTAFTLLFMGIFLESIVVIKFAGAMIILSLLFLLIEPFIYKEEKEFG